MPAAASSAVPCRLVFYDDQTNGGQVPGIYTKLLDVDKVDIVTSPYATAMIAPGHAGGDAAEHVLRVALRRRREHRLQVRPPLQHERGRRQHEGDLCPRLPRHRRQAADSPPRSIAILAVDNDFAQRAAESARFLAKERGIRVVYDRSYPPSTVDFTPDHPRHRGDPAGRGLHRLLPAGFQRHPARDQRAALPAADVRRRHGRPAARRLPAAARPHPEQPGELGRLFARADHAIPRRRSPSSRSTASSRRASRRTCWAITSRPMPMRRCRCWSSR